MTRAPVFPPLLQGVSVTGHVDPFGRACAMAALGCDGGTVVHNVLVDRLRAAMVFAPEVALEDAMAMLPVCGVGFQNALGALAPPEVAVHLSWDGVIRVNGARCGYLKVAASATDPAEAPDWLAVGLELSLIQTESDPGTDPDVTALYDEGCAELDPVELLESWARHTLVWINRWDEEGGSAVHDEWVGLVPDVGEQVELQDRHGQFLGVDERFGALIRDAKTTHLIPMSALLKDPK